MKQSSHSSKRSPGRPKRGQQEPAARDSIMQAASILFMEHGYKPVSMQQVANSVGITKASVYYYFAGKSDLFAAAVTAMMERIRVSTLRKLAEPGSLRERLEKIAESKLNHSHIEFESMMREAIFSLTEEQQKQILQAENAIHEMLAEHFSEAIAKSELADADPLLLSHAFASLLMIGNRKDELQLGPAERSLAKQIVDLFWFGAAPGNGVS